MVDPHPVAGHVPFQLIPHLVDVHHSMLGLEVPEQGEELVADPPGQQGNPVLLQDGPVAGQRVALAAVVVVPVG